MLISITTKISIDIIDIGIDRPIPALTHCTRAKQQLFPVKLLQTLRTLRKVADRQTGPALIFRSRLLVFLENPDTWGRGIVWLGVCVRVWVCGVGGRRE